MSTWHYNDTPLPVGNPVRMNGRDGSYELGLYDGAYYDDQYADEPEASILFESPEAAKAWLGAVIAVLTPYIEAADRSPRVPSDSGWSR